MILSPKHRWNYHRCRWYYYWK